MQSYSVFEHFRRGYFVIDTTDYGYVAMIPVGLDTIGSVVFEDNLKKVTSDNPVPINKGDKIGHFAYGGSTEVSRVKLEAVFSNIFWYLSTTKLPYCSPRSSGSPSI